MKTNLLLLFIALCFFGNAQTKKTASIEETENWIKEKIEEHPFNSIDGKTKNSYDIKFDQTDLIIINDHWTDTYGKLVIYNRIKLKEIDHISIIEKDHNVWLTIKLIPGAKEWTMVNLKTMESDGETEILLNKSFLDENMKVRMKKAFAWLIELHGGKKSVDTEPF